MKNLMGLLTAVCACAATNATTYNIDPAHTYVTFEIDHFVSTNRGRFDRKQGAVEFDAQAKTGRVDLEIDTASISTGLPAFNKHLQGKDFFNAEHFPTARFVAGEFIFNGDKLSEVAGVLTLVGKSHPVRLKALRFGCVHNAMLKREVCGGDFETTLARSLWGIDWGVQRGYPDNVRLLVQVEAIKQ